MNSLSLTLFSKSEFSQRRDQIKSFRSRSRERRVPKQNKKNSKEQLHLFKKKLGIIRHFRGATDTPVLDM